MKKKIIWLALSGWWARWLAHIWVYQALVENNWEIWAISGSSMWAIIWMMIASGLTAKQIINMCNDINIKYIPKNEFTASIVTKKMMEKLWERINYKNIEDLKIPFYVHTTSLNSGKWCTRSSGSLKEIVTASGSLPLINNPVVINNESHIDGGFTNNMPVEILQIKHKKLDLYIWSDVNYYNPSRKSNFDNTQTLLRSIAILFQTGTQKQKELCDIYICPPKLSKIWMFDFDDIDEAYKIWYEYTNEIIKKYKKVYW